MEEGGGGASFMHPRPRPLAPIQRPPWPGRSHLQLRRHPELVSGSSWSFDTPSRQARRLLRMSGVDVLLPSPRSSRVGPSLARPLSRDEEAENRILLRSASADKSLKQVHHDDYSMRQPCPQGGGIWTLRPWAQAGAQFGLRAGPRLSPGNGTDQRMTPMPGSIGSTGATNSITRSWPAW